jgi:hypothetical protein
VAAREVVGGVLLAADQLLGVEQLAVGAGADLVDHGGLQVEEDAAGDVLARAGLGEEGVEGVVAAADGLVAGHLRPWWAGAGGGGLRGRGRGAGLGAGAAAGGAGERVARAAPGPAHLAIGLDAVLQAVELPAGIADLGEGAGGAGEGSV